MSLTLKGFAAVFLEPLQELSEGYLNNRAELHCGDVVVHAAPDGSHCTATVMAVHKEDPALCYFTIGFADGSKKQTGRTTLCCADVPAKLPVLPECVVQWLVPDKDVSSDDVSALICDSATAWQNRKLKCTLAAEPAQQVFLR